MSKGWLNLKFKRASVSLVLALVVAVSISVVNARPALAYSGTCWCTEYMSNIYGLTGFPDAHLWGDAALCGIQTGCNYLKKQNWHLDSSPNIGDIIVFNPGVTIYVTNPVTLVSFNYTMDATAGHVARVKALKYSATGPYWTVTWQGAHQNISPAYTANSCTDVSDLQFIADGNSPGEFEFWHP